MRSKLDIDLRVDPAPDLALEAEVSRSALDGLAILASLAYVRCGVTTASA